MEDDQALVWSGSADSVGLHPMLPASGSWNFSDAYGIDKYGDVFGTADGTFGGLTGYFAVEWSPMPKPSSPLPLQGFSYWPDGGCVLHGSKVFKVEILF